MYELHNKSIYSSPAGVAKHRVASGLHEVKYHEKSIDLLIEEKVLAQRVRTHYGQDCFLDELDNKSSLQ